ncbi:MAG: hypothetical protein AAF571_13420 [Verrucomicrobiota bacterium]
MFHMQIKGSLYRVAGLLMFIGACTPLYSVTTVTEGGRFVTVDLEDFIAGSLVGEVGSNRYQIFENLGDPGSGILTTTEIGFTINGYLSGGSTDRFTALYDTDRREYTTSTTGSGGTVTRVYDNINSRVTGSEGNAATGEDPDLEIDDQGTGQWEGGNVALTTRVGNMVLVQENISTTEQNQGHLHFAQGQDAAGATSTSGNHAPDDLVGGEMEFNFEAALVDFDFIWVDLETPSVVTVTFGGLEDEFGNSLADVTISFDEFEDGATYDKDADWGDRHINAISIGLTDSVTGSAFDGLTRTSGPPGTADAVSFDSVYFDTGTNSGGVSQFAYRLKDPVVVYPEASSALSLMMLISFGIFHSGRKKRMQTVLATQ